MKKSHGIIVLSLLSFSCLSQVEAPISSAITQVVEKTTALLPQNETVKSLNTALDSYKRVLLSGKIEKSLD
ncbi:MAG: hypothetical protein KAG10_10590, partial [Methylococcales bacterium]|nr:hypothetical protein [Methylococcales bacterium]